MSNPVGSILDVQTHYLSVSETYHVQYKPTITGTHEIELSYGGKPVTGSPFTVNVFNPSQCSAKVPKNGFLNKPVVVEINASKAGKGQIDIAVNEGIIPCNVEYLENKSYKAVFTPTEPGQYVVEMNFNSIAVEGSPWYVAIADPDGNKISKSGAKNFMQVAPVHQPRSFEISANNNVDVQILTPSKKFVPYRRSSLTSGGTNIEYEFTEIGDHSIVVTYENKPVKGSPFLVHVFDPSAVTVEPVVRGFAGESTEINIYTSMAGDGELELEVNKGEIDWKLTKIKSGHYLAKMVFPRPCTASLNILYNRALVQGSPFRFPIVDSSTATVNIPRTVCANRLSLIHVYLYGIKLSACTVLVQVDASGAGKGTLDLAVGPPGKNLPHQIKSVGQQLFQVEFEPQEAVMHEVAIKFDDMHIQGSPVPIPFYPPTPPPPPSSPPPPIDTPDDAPDGSPFNLQAPYIDASQVTVSGDGLVMSRVHQQAMFTVNATRLDASVQPSVSIAGPLGQSVYANVSTVDRGMYRVTWEPSTAGDHVIRVTVADREVPRSPFKVRVADPTQVQVEAPANATIGSTADVAVDVSRAGLGKLVVVISVDGLNVPNTVHQDGPSQYRFSFRPNIAKPHGIMVQFNGENVPGSPFSCSVTGGSRNVQLIDKQMTHSFGQPVEIEIDARGAGEGQLVAEVRSETGGVPSDLVASPHTKKVYLLTFTPREGGQHSVTVTFNDETVPQSPMPVHVIGGPQLQNDTSNYTMQSTQSHSSEQQPIIQKHTEIVNYQQQAPPTHDMSMYRQEVHRQEIQQVPPPISSHEVVYQMSPPPPPQFVTEANYQQSVSSGRPSLTESVHMQQNGYNSPSPQYRTQQSNEQLIRTITYQPQYEIASANEKTYFEVNPHGLSLQDVDVRLHDPYGKEVSVSVSRVGDKFRYEFTPRATGKYLVSVNVNDSALPGSPFTYFVQPSSGVKVKDVTEEGLVGEEMYFIVDASDAGNGDIDVEVSCQSQLTRIKREPLGNGQFRYMYIPKRAGDHMIDVQFNYQRVPGCPIRAVVTDPYRSLDRGSAYGVQTTPRISGVSGRGIQSFPVAQQTYFILEMGGKNWRMQDVEVDVRGFPPFQAHRRSGAGTDTDDSVFAADGAPNGESVPVKLYQDGNDEIRVEYQSPYVGRHLVDIFYRGHKIAGSPYYVEVFDPKKVALEQMAKETYLHEQTEFEVVNDEAGQADMECRVISPSGRAIPCRLVDTERGMKVKYTPEEPGVYYVHTYIGGVEIPGSPMTQVVRAHTLQRGGNRQEIREYHSDQRSGYERDTLGRITVSGDGLHHGEEDKPAHFYIDTHGMDGTPEVKVEGPHSVAKCSVVPDGSHRYKVTYVPVETGIYNVYVKWFGQEIEGSPFHPRIVDARKVRAHGDWSTKLDQEQRIKLKVNEMKRLLFDVTEAGPGELKAEVRHVGTGRNIPVTVSEKDQFHYYVDFVPPQAGDYMISINWTDTPIPNSPMRGYAPVDVQMVGQATSQQTTQQTAGGASGREYSSKTTKTITKSGSSGANSKVVLTGTGLKEGIAGMMSEFYIDGSKAGEGLPSVMLKNSRLEEVPIQMSRVGERQYKCTYLVDHPGAYMLYVSWADRDLENCPYTVMVRDGADMSTMSSSQSFQQHNSSQQQRNGGLIVPAQQGQQLQSGSSHQNGGMKSSQYTHTRKAKVYNANSQQGQSVGENFQLMINAEHMAPGEIVARCTGPTQPAHCELTEQGPGMYSLNIKPRESGEHHLSVTYQGQDIAGSPYNFIIQGPAKPDPTKVKVHGPGIEHGILANYQSRFFVETEGAGSGNLSVKMRGPKGGFQATMRRVSQTSRTIECNYQPTEVGLYVIHIKWSDVDIPGSPFHVHIFDTFYELDRFKASGILPSEMREHHILQLKQPNASFQTSAYQTNTLKKTLKKFKKGSKKSAAAQNGGQQYVIAQPPPAQYVVREPSYPRESGYMMREVTSSRDPNYVVAGPGHVINKPPVHVANGGGGFHEGGGRGSSYYRESHYTSGGGGGGTYNGPTSFVAHENGPQYAQLIRK